MSPRPWLAACALAAWFGAIGGWILRTITI